MEKVFEVNELKKSFGSISAVKDVSFSVDQGEVLGIIGPNGAGKTTLFDLIMGVHKLDHGNITFKGKNINHLKTFERVNLGIARSFQFARSFSSLSIHKHIRMAMISGKSLFRKIKYKKQTKRASQIAEMVHLNKYLDKYPCDLNIEELRKLELALAIAVGSDLLLLDEMFAGLTENEANGIIDIIKTIIKTKKPATVIIIDHNLAAMAGIVNRVIAIDLGEMIADGTFEEVLRNEVVKKAYLGDYVQQGVLHANINS